MSNAEVKIRPLRSEDVSTVVNIEREAFPTMWPPTPIRKELHNNLALYLVAWMPKSAESNLVGPFITPHVITKNNFLDRVIYIGKRALSTGTLNHKNDESILGFVGLWFIAGDAHMTAIAVREQQRGKGLGELLLISSIQAAIEKQSVDFSLEVRVSNLVAISLYTKYGFKKVGLRKGYYIDNREDAIVMSCRPINTSSYLIEFQELKEDYIRKYGELAISLI